jgi:pantoate--beta-alanine ligase
VTKLFHLLSPHAAVFGEKDFQQLAIIRRMVRDLQFPIEIIGAPTVRETDGLACSSRNQYLSAEERTQAPVLRAALLEAAERVRGGERSSDRIVAGRPGADRERARGADRLRGARRFRDTRGEANREREFASRGRRLLRKDSPDR